jgi:cytochrome c biogenesis protein CcmG/thiol:disulfide interchange protein DsbE
MLPVYGLNVPDPDVADPRADALRWLAPRGDPFVFSAVDTDGRVSVDWGVYGAPETFLLGRDGTVLHKRVGQLTPDVWEREFLPLIEEQCGKAPCARPGS